MNRYYTKTVKVICIATITLQAYCLLGGENNDMSTLNNYLKRVLMANKDIDHLRLHNPKLIKDNDYYKIKKIKKTFIINNWNTLSNLNKNKDLTESILLKILYIDVDYNRYNQIMNVAIHQYDNKKIKISQFVNIYTYGEPFWVFNYHSPSIKKPIERIAKILMDNGHSETAKNCKNILTGLRFFNIFRYDIHQPSKDNFKRFKKYPIYSGIDLKTLMGLATQTLGYEVFTGFSKHDPGPLKKIKLENITKKTSFNEIKRLLSSEPQRPENFNDKVSLIERCFRLTHFSLPFLSKTLQKDKYSVAKKKMIIDIIIKNLYAREQAHLLLFLLRHEDVGVSIYTKNKLSEKFFGKVSSIDKKQVIERLMSKKYINLTR